MKVSTTRNEALALASGKYILQVDSDDWMEREMVEKMTRMAEERNADIVWCDYFQNYETKEKICSQTCEENSEFCTRKLLLSELHPAFWNKLIKRELYVKNQVACVPGINFCEDMVCTVRLFAAAKRVAYLPEPLYHYRYSPNSITKWLTLRDYEEQFILHSVLRHDLPAGKYDREVLLREIGILAEIAVRYPEAESLKKIDQISREEIQQAPLHWSKKKLLLARKQKQKIRFLGLQKLLKCLIISRAWLRRINA